MRAPGFFRRLRLMLSSLFLFLSLSLCPLATAVAQPSGAFEGIRGVLLVGKFRTDQELNRMSREDQRNTLITELTNRTKDNVGFYQSLDDKTLSGTGALLVYLRGTGSRTDQAIKTMSADDMRNTTIVEVAHQTGRGSDLQALNNTDLIRLVLGRDSYIRGVLLVGKFRTQQELNGMSHEDQRNTLITELTNRTKNNVGFYQSMDDKTLAGTGALLVYLRGTASRTDQEIKTMSADDMRNTTIVQVSALPFMRGWLNPQAVNNLDLAKLVLSSFDSPALSPLVAGSPIRAVQVVNPIDGQVVFNDNTFFSSQHLCDLVLRPEPGSMPLDQRIRSQVADRVNRTPFKMRSNSSVSLSASCNAHAEVLATGSPNIRIIVNLPQNRLNLVLTTPDVHVFGVGLGAPGSVDPRVNMAFDLSLHTNIIVPPATGQPLRSEGAGGSTSNTHIVDRNLTAAAGEVVNDVVVFFGGDGFLRGLTDNRTFDASDLGNFLGRANSQLSRLPPGVGYVAGYQRESATLVLRPVH